MRDTLAAILDFYRRPLSAPSRAMDECGVVWAAIPAIILCLILNGIDLRHRAENMAALVTQVSQTAAQPAPDAGKTAPSSQPGERPAPAVDPRVAAELQRQFQPPAFTLGFSWLILLAVVFVPVAILIFVVWQAAGGFTTILMRDYAPTLLCLLIAWTAAYAPVVLIRAVLSAVPHAAVVEDAVTWAGHGYFAFLAVCCLRTVMGLGFGPAIVTAAGAAICSAGGFFAYGFMGNAVYYLASPWFLFYFYRQFQSGVLELGSGLSGRQSLRRSLAASTLNPRDADAHYQLGLIYQQRRQYTEAVSRFQKAIEIDPREPAPHYQLGRIALEQERYQEALDEFCKVVEVDQKHAANEVWRDIGVACLHLNDQQNAIAALQRYTERREYDPEGLFWFGKALAAASNSEGAADAWQKAIDAARTMPSHRRRQMSKWGSRAKAELKAIGAKAS